MKNLLLASAALAVITAHAHADELAYNWAGSYLGVEAGYARSSMKFEGASSNTFDGRYNEDGYLGGIYGGHDWQVGDFVFGVMGDIDAVSIDETAFGDVDPVAGGKGEAYSYDIDWMASGRVRVGHTPLDGLLVYGTGGIAAARFVATNYEYPAFGFASSSEFSGVKWGGVFGAGAEYAFAENWSTKTELLHYVFDHIEPGPGGNPDARFKPTLTTVKIGVAYRF